MNLGDFIALGMDEQRRILDAASRQSRSKALLDFLIDLRIRLDEYGGAFGVVQFDPESEMTVRERLIAEIKSLKSNAEHEGQA